MAWYDLPLKPLEWAYNAILNSANYDNDRDGIPIPRRGNRIPRKGDSDYTQGGLMTSYPSDVMKAVTLITDASKPLMDMPQYSPASSGGTGTGSGTWITGNTNSGESTFEDSAEVPEEIYGEWTPYLEYLREESERNTAFSVNRTYEGKARNHRREGFYHYKSKLQSNYVYVALTRQRTCATTAEPSVTYSLGIRHTEARDSL